MAETTGTSVRRAMHFGNENDAREAIHASFLLSTSHVKTMVVLGKLMRTSNGNFKVSRSVGKHALTSTAVG